MKRRSGQILILVLLVVVVALAIGMSVASRNLANLRTSTQTEQSQRAFSAAEGGVEDVLSNLSSIVSNPDIASPGGVDLDVAVGQITANVNVKAANIYETVVEEGTVAQVNLDGYSGNVKLDWILVLDNTENDVNGDSAFNMASIEVTFVCQSSSNCLTSAGSGSSYSQHRAAFQAEPISQQDGFVPCGAPSDSRFRCGVSFSVPAGDNAKVMRIRTFWRKATVKVLGDPVLPTQAYDVVSTATTPDLGITRRVQVTRTALPQLPASFDYVLFSEGDIVK
ncbi:hypothetical protein HYZ70_02805 [Candidatus Curtissbacteria bacterium]|nr:hypothetical protein [Candidatus Curtissbacteria bacterium]